MFEIERKWLLKDLPFVSKKTNLIGRYYVTQLYLCKYPEIRIRECVPEYSKYPKDPKPYTLAIKGKSNMFKRLEIEFKISEKVFDFFINHSKRRPIHKYYQKSKMGKYILEASEVDGRFYYGEIEFESVKDAEEFEPPIFLRNLIIQEVTKDPEYKMCNYFYRK